MLLKTGEKCTYSMPIERSLSSVKYGRILPVIFSPKTTVKKM